MTASRGQVRRVATTEMTPAPATFAAATRKGSDPGAVGAPELTAVAGAHERATPIANGPALIFAAGVSGTAAGDFGSAWLGALRGGLAQRWAAFELDVTLIAETGRVAPTRENRFGVEVLPLSWAQGDRRVRVGGGIGAGGGAALQRSDQGVLYWSGMAWLSPTLLVQTRIDRQFTFDVIAQLPIAAVRRDDHLVAELLPSAWIGLTRRF